MGWKDRFKPPVARTPSAIERIRTADSLEPESKWDGLSSSVLETYAEAEKKLRPHFEANTLASDVILENGRHVGGVSFHQYDGAGEAWAARMRRQMLIQGPLPENGPYRLTSGDIKRIAPYVGQHAAEWFIQSLQADLKDSKKPSTKVKVGEFEDFSLVHDWELAKASNKALLKWLKTPANQEAFNQAFQEMFAWCDISKIESTDYWISTISREGRKNFSNTSVADRMATMPTHEFFSPANAGKFLKKAFAPLNARLEKEEGILRSEQAQSAQR